MGPPTQVKPNDYRARVRAHLKRHNPKTVKEAEAAGELSRLVPGMAEGIADWVNSQTPSVNPDEPLEKRVQLLTSAKAMAESEAFREDLPRDEGSQQEIGPSGGYKD